MKAQSILQLLTLIFLIFPQTTQQGKQACNQIMMNWLIHPENLPAEVYMNSGKFINDLGDYNNCVYNQDEFTYFTMRFTNRLVGLQYIGLCAPNSCKNEIANNTFALTLQEYLNDIYKEKTNSTVGIFFGTTFYIPLEDQPQMDWSNYLVIAVIVIICILGIAGSVIHRFTKANTFPIKIIKCFSFSDNFSKIITVPKTSENENLLILNGMRIFSIFWIVFGHDMWFRFMNIKNWMETLNILATPGLPTLVPAAYFAVDTFFWIGGFLITIGLIDQIVKNKNFLKFYIGCIVHRLIRIWPTYILAIMIFWKVAPYLSNGPIWQTFSIFTSSCANGGIFWNLFFIDNFGDHGPSGMNYCFGWGWYLAVDFQLFLITPFIILAYVKNRKLGWIVTYLLFLASVITAFVLIVVHNWRYPLPNPNFKPQPDFMDGFYYKPYVRASAYFMGIFSGFIYNQWKTGHAKTVYIVNKIKGSIPIRVAFYVVGITLCELMIWIIVPYQVGGMWSTLAQAFYNSFNRVIFLIGVYLCVFAAMFGCENDPVKYILGHKMFSPLAKVSFCIYLMHFVVIMSSTFSGKMDLYWEPYSAVYMSISDIFWSVIVAAMLSLMVESPTLGLEKLLLRGGGGKKKEKSKEESIKFEESQGLTHSTRPSVISNISSECSEMEKPGEIA